MALKNKKIKSNFFETIIDFVKEEILGPLIVGIILLSVPIYFKSQTDSEISMRLPRFDGVEKYWIRIV
jgi:hypothetical protein